MTPALERKFQRLKWGMDATIVLALGIIVALVWAEAWLDSVSSTLGLVALITNRCSLKQLGGLS